MKTIFSAGKRSLRGPRFVVVYAQGNRVEYELTYGANEQEQRAWQQKLVNWGKDRQYGLYPYGGGRRVAYLINVYPRAKP